MDRQAAAERFEALVADHAPPLLAYALRRVGQPADAVDVVAETLLVAWRRLDTVPEGERARFWLYAVCRNAVGNHYRGRGRRTKLAERLQAQYAHAVTPDPGPAVATAHTVRAAMERLGPEDRELLRLVVWEELRPGEVAEVLGIPAGNVRTRLHRARNRLREALLAEGLRQPDDPPGQVTPRPSTFTSDQEGTSP
jgi:RNA polymerase sigma-70 factor (ECF subfamily)